MSYAVAVAELFVDEVLRHRALVPGDTLARCAVTFAVSDDAGWTTATALIDERGDVVAGDVRPPGLPWLRVAASEPALRALFGGRGDVASLALLGEVDVEGDPALLADVAACFAAGESPLSVRFGR